MRRTTVLFCLILVPACCCPRQGGGGYWYGVEVQAGGASWPAVFCPPGEPYTAEQRLTDIKGWAMTASRGDVVALADACMGHTGVAAANEQHCAKAYSACSAAQSAATSPGLTEEQRGALWALCVSELTHDGNGGGVAASAGSASWPAMICPPGSGISAAQRLQEIIGWASSNHPDVARRPDVVSLAENCMGGHTGPAAANGEHCAKVYAAWTAAKQAGDPENGFTPAQRRSLWSVSVSELTHDGNGGGVALGTAN